MVSKVRVKGLRPRESWIHLAELRFTGPDAENNALQSQYKLKQDVKNFFKNNRNASNLLEVGDVNVLLTEFAAISVSIEPDY